MGLSENFVINDDGRHGVIIGDHDQWHYRVVVCDTGKEEAWHFQLLTWPHLIVGSLEDLPSKTGLSQQP